jgi:hypothetical protein
MQQVSSWRCARTRRVLVSSAQRLGAPRHTEDLMLARSAAASANRSQPSSLGLPTPRSRAERDAPSLNVRGARMARREEGACWRACNRRATKPAGMDRTLRWSSYFGTATKRPENASERRTAQGCYWRDAARQRRPRHCAPKDHMPTERTAFVYHLVSTFASRRSSCAAVCSARGDPWRVGQSDGGPSFVPGNEALRLLVAIEA